MGTVRDLILALLIESGRRIKLSTLLIARAILVYWELGKTNNSWTARDDELYRAECEVYRRDRSE